VDRVILLLKIDDKYVPIAESAVEIASLVSVNIGDSIVVNETKLKNQGVVD
jgi:hypothetical protein